MDPQIIQPGCLGNQEQFLEIYESRGENTESEQRIAHARLSATLRPLLAHDPPAQPH